ncbi:hypothetical protein PRIPAC_81757 [Pristionchus pacificus]|uniref:Nuclear receptor n=1 Tax=Pristionchus pacificus TaxID=54126 RepID=A0A2A6CPK9_PRIPA|nr:hypothetical protein PRIPAC_81757 [Pristionchus pacificus]|eukprot:PDM79983.1 nuclear receptor [Pristionchus pacificus]
MSRPCCIICTAPCNYARYGADACRSCSDFYRRSLLSGRTFPCRKGDGKCTIRPYDRHNYRGCRYEQCSAVMKFGPKSTQIEERSSSPISAQFDACPGDLGKAPESPSQPVTLTHFRLLTQCCNANSQPYQTEMECLICSEPINNSRLGVNSCRACAAFFKRNESQFDRLKCKWGRNDCRERDPKTTCRKCRLARFREVLSQAGQGFPIVELKPYEDEPKLPAFIDHTSFYETEPSHSETPLLNRIRKGYSYMCVIRRCGEKSLTGDYSGDGAVRTENMVLTPASYSSFVQIHGIEREAMLESANFSFEEFRNLKSSSKYHIIDRSLLVVDVLESTYRACQHFPDDPEVGFSGYTTFLRECDLESFFANCPDEIDSTIIIREFKRTLQRLSLIVRQLFEIIKPEDMEFVALFGLAIWKEENMKHDEDLLKVASQMRTDIMRELHIYYAKKGTPDYANRLGSLFCLIMNCEDCATLFAEDFQLFRLLRLWESSFRLK